MPEAHNKYHNTAPPGAVYVGRPSKWGNPFSVEEHGRGEALSKFHSWVFENEQAELRNQARRELKGKDLVCFCKPKPCHADLWLEIANNTPMVATKTNVETNHDEENNLQGGRATRSD